MYVRGLRRLTDKSEALEENKGTYVLYTDNLEGFQMSLIQENAHGFDSMLPGKEYVRLCEWVKWST